MRLGTIVEGHGDALALPTLITRLCNEWFERYDVLMAKPPLRVNRSRFSERFDDFPKALTLLAAQSDGILVVLDSDDDDPSKLRADLESRAREIVGHVPVRVAPAVREYESWFLTCAANMAGKLGLRDDAVYEANPEAVRDAKGEFRKLTSNHVYSETVDQKKFTALLDLAVTADGSASFAQLIAVLGELLGPRPDDA